MKDDIEMAKCSKYITIILILLLFPTSDVVTDVLSSTSDNTWHEFSVGVIASVVAAILSLIWGFFYRTILDCWRNGRFRKFFGGCKAFTFILDYYKNQNRSIEMGYCNAKILNYLSPLFSKHTGRYPNVVLDSDVMKANDIIIIDWEQTLVLFGSPATNDVTKKMITEKYVKFIYEQDEAKIIKIINTDYQGEPLDVKNGHYGVVQKLDNHYSKGYFLFFLAGLTNQATSAGGLLLRNNWRKILKNTGKDEFLIAYKVLEPGIDQSYEILHTDPPKLKLVLS